MKNLLGILEKITPVSWWIDPSQYMEWPAKKFVIFYSVSFAIVETKVVAYKLCKQKLSQLWRNFAIF